jgi:hypothetical protein
MPVSTITLINYKTIANSGESMLEWHNMLTKLLRSLENQAMYHRELTVAVLVHLEKGTFKAAKLTAPPPSI